eukprot:2367937-Amphidinium_carterae.1
MASATSALTPWHCKDRSSMTFFSSRFMSSAVISACASCMTSMARALAKPHPGTIVPQTLQAFVACPLHWIRLGW